MHGFAFFDTNVLVYTDDTRSPEKQERAIDLVTEHLGSRRACISLQVLQEYFVAATRKLGVAPELAQAKIELLARAHVVQFGPADIVAAIELHRLIRIPFWDALIVQAARSAKAAVLYSEDLQPGAVLAGVRVVNPFQE